MHKLTGWHFCEGNYHGLDWRVHPDYDLVLKLEDIEHLLTSERLQSIKHKEICWRNSGLGKGRYKKCDISIPGIVATNSRNPDNLKYRMIDGRHRMAKMKSKDITESLFYIIDLRRAGRNVSEECRRDPFFIATISRSRSSVGRYTISANLN